MVKKRIIAVLLIIGTMTSCSDQPAAVEKGEFITRLSADKTDIPPPTPQPRPSYPWDNP